MDIEYKMFNVMSEPGEIYEAYINPNFIVVIEPSDYTIDDFTTTDIVTTKGTYKCIDGMKEIIRILE